MMPTCPLCALKHIAEAEILLGEALMGYPRHYFRCLGALSMAANELVRDHRDLANFIRAERKKLELNPKHKVDFEELIGTVCEVTGCDVTAALEVKVP